MIIIHTDGGSGSEQQCRNNSTPTTMAAGSFRVVRPQRKDWVRFDNSSDDSEGDEDSFKNIEIDSETNRLNLQLDLDNFESVEINLVKKRKSQKCSRVIRTASDVLVRNLEILRQSGFYYEKADFNGEVRFWRRLVMS